MLFLTGLLAGMLAAAHVFAAMVHVIADRHRRRWYSFASGVAIGYMFIHILPELSDHQSVLRPSQAPTGTSGREIYLVALIGVCAYYGLERLAVAFRRAPRPDAGEQAIAQRVFWVHMVSFALYNALAGYLLIRRDAPTAFENILFAVALGLHFLVNDFALWQHHRESYTRRGRWLLAVAVLFGWGVGAAYALPEMIVAVLFAFLAGGIVINVLKEELPEERQGSFAAFIAGVAAYAAILLATE